MKILDFLEEKEVVRFELNEDKTLTNVLECCDYCFGVDLSKQQLKQLISELEEIHEKMLE